MNSELPSEWNICDLEELCDWVGVGIASSTTHAYAKEGVALLRNQNILPNRIRKSDLLYITDAFSEENASKKLREGDVITVRTGYPGVSAVVPKEFNGCHSFTTLISRPRSRTLDSDYLSTLINSDYGRKFVTGGQAGGAQQNLNVAILRTFPVILPPLEEQRRIATVLSSVDGVIDKTQAQIDKLKDLKTGMMQELLTRGIGHTEFKDSPMGRIPVGWEVKTIADIVAKERYSIVDGPFGSSINTKKDYIDEGVPVIRTVNIRPFKFIHNDLKFISEELFEKVKRSAVYPNDVLLSKVGTIGYSCLLPHTIQKAILSTTGSCKISVDTDLISPEYLCYSLNHMKPFMDLIASEGVQPFLNMNTIKSFFLRIPSLDEQNSIVNALDSIARKMETHELKLTQTQNIKKALMQDLLTGKVRVKVES